MVDVTPDDTDYQQFGGDRGLLVQLTDSTDSYLIDLIPSAFACNVCKLVLRGQQELDACDLPSSRMDVQDYQLGSDFDPRKAASPLDL